MFQDMLQKGQISLVVLYVLNPVFILFYQNCSPPNHAQANQAVYSKQIAGSVESASTSTETENSQCWAQKINRVCPQK